MKTKDKILWILAFISQKIIPILLVAFFGVGVFFNLWKVQQFSITLSVLISLGIFSVCLYGLGKLIKLW